MLNSIGVKSVLLFSFRGEQSWSTEIWNCTMSVTTDHSLKICRQFPAFLLFLWQSICRVVRELKSCYRVTLPSQLSGRYCMKKKKNGRCPFLHLVNFTEFCPSYISCYSVSSGGICQNRIPGICLVNLSWSYTFLSWLCHGYLSPLNVSW